jgi:hypothetical protein
MAIRIYSRYAQLKKTSRTNSTFGFCRHKSQHLKKPKELFFANARTDKQTIKSKFDELTIKI